MKTYEQEQDKAANILYRNGYARGYDEANARAEKVIEEKDKIISECSGYTFELEEKLASRDAMIEKLEKTLKNIKESCLCERFKTKGFDYAEDHKRMGKPEIGARWVTPRDRIFLMLAELEEWKKTR